MQDMLRDCEIGFVTLSSSPFLREVKMDLRDIEEEVLLESVFGF